MPERPPADFRDQGEAGQPGQTSDVAAAADRLVVQMQQVNQQQAEEDPGGAGSGHGLERFRRARAVRRDGPGNLMRLRELDRGLMRGLLDALQDRLQLRAGGVEVAGHGIQRDLLAGRMFGGLLRRVQVRFQAAHALRRGVLIGFDRRDDAGGFGCQGALPLSELAAEAERFGVGAAETSLFGLDLRRQTVLLRPQLHDRRGDRRLGGGALLAAGRIELAVRPRLLGAGRGQFLGQAGDLLGVGAGVDALAETVRRPERRRSFLRTAERWREAWRPGLRTAWRRRRSSCAYRHRGP